MSRSPYLSNPNILAHPDRIVETVALDLTAQETYLAGSPINAEGKLANDETAIGILLYDVRKRAGGKRGVVVVSGRINQEAAAAWCGVTISDAAKSALVNITFSDDGARMGVGGEIPFFDLVEMGLPALTPAETVSVSVDTTAIIAALEKGLVRLKVKFPYMDQVAVCSSVAIPAYYTHTCTWVTNASDGNYVVQISIVPGTIYGTYTAL